MIYVGIDLAAQPRNTAMCSIAAKDGKLRLDPLATSVTDQEIITAALGATVTAIDAPFGFPREFEDTMRSYIATRTWKQTSEPNRKEIDNSDLRLRETEKRLSGNALSSSASLLTVTTWRCLRILSALHSGGITTDARRGRVGHPCVIETYPAESLRRWGIDSIPKKSNIEQRARLIQHVCEQSPSLKEFVGDSVDPLTKSSHGLDAFIACLTAIAFDAGHVRMPDVETGHEGWIFAPSKPLDDSVRWVIGEHTN